MRITHLGHACLLIEAAGQRILIDPGAFVPDFADATDLDAIVVTHQHADHLDQKRILDIRRRNRSALVVADPQSTAILVGLGIDTTAQDGTDHQVGPVTIRPVGKKHALIHNGLLNETGRKLYLSQARTLGCAATEIIDLAGAGPVDLT